MLLFCLQAALTRGDSCPRSKLQLADKQVAALERALSVLSTFSPQSEKRYELEMQLRAIIHRLSSSYLSLTDRKLAFVDLAVKAAGLCEHCA